MKRVGFAEAYYDSFTGAQQSMLPLLTETSNLIPILLTPKQGKCTERFSSLAQIQVIEYPDELDKFGGRLLNQPLYHKSIAGMKLINYYRSVKNSLQNLNLDVLYCNNIRALLLFGPPAKLLNIPIIWYVRIDTPTPYIDRMGLELADEVITISNGVRERFNKNELDKYNSKIQTIYTGIDMSEFDPSADYDNIFDIDQNKLIITQVASIQPRKGQHRVVNAIAAIKDDLPEFQIIFAGPIAQSEKEYAQSIYHTIDEEGLDEEIKFIGWCDDIPTLLNYTDIFVLPSVNEGLPRSILEASSMGVPTIATSAGGTAEIVQHGKTGLIIDENDPESLSRTIRKLASDDSLRSKLGCQAQTLVENKFSQKRYTDEFDILISEI